MKINAKLLVIAFIFAMIFSVSAVAAAENVTAQTSELTQVPHEQVVSVAEPTVQEVETMDLETSDIKEKAQTYEITSSSDNLNSTDSNKGSLKTSKKGGQLLGASNNEDVLGANTIYVDGDSFADLRNAIDRASDTDVIDLQGKTIYGYGGQISCQKAITIANGSLNGNSYVSTYVFAGCTLENLTLSNFHTEGGTAINNCNLNNVVFDNFLSDKACTFAVRYCNLENVNFTNCHSLMPEDPSGQDFESGVMIVTYGSRYNNCYFVNCSSKRHSGAICVAGAPGNTANITNCVFDNCTSGVGGAVYLHGTGLDENHHSNIINCTFTNCEASEWGGAIGSSQDYLNVENCDFVNNTAKQGAAFMVGGITHGLDGDNSQGHHNTMNNCYFYNNTGSEEGGAVHITGHYNSAIDCTFDDNFAVNGKGAAIYVEGDHASIDNSKFTNHKSEMGTVYIEGNYFNCTDSTFDSNYASNGGAGIYVEGNDTLIDNSHFTNNNASRHGGAVHSIGDNAKILNSKFYYNNAIPSSENSDYGLGGAVFISGDNNEISFSTFKHNTARNGSAIYNRGGDLVLNDDTFEDNQAWSYFLFTEAKPPEAYWSEDLEVLVNVTLVAGDNLINAIYNDRSVFDIEFHNVTYYMNPTDLYPTGRRTTGLDEIHPVKGVENSQGGKYLYQDAREDNQVIKVNITYDDNKVFEYAGKTDMYGNVLLSIKKENLSDRQYHPGVYNVTASHPDDTIYTAIDNSTKFTVLPHVDVSVTKTSDKDVYFVGENAIFTIKVYGVGTNATDVKVKDLLPKSFQFVDAKATQGSYDEVNNVWDVGFLPHEASHTLTLTVKTTELGTFDNVVNVTCTEKDWNLSNNVDNKTIHVDLYYTKEANVTKTSAGEYIEYYIRVYNVGSTDYTEVVRVHDVLPEGVRYANYYKVEGADLVKHIGYPDEQVWEITNITAGTHAKITLKALAVKDGVWNNTVQVWNYPPVNATVNVTSNADLRIFKEASSEYVNKGDLVNWTVIVKNDGPSKAMDVYVNDVLPNGLEIYGTTIASKGNYNRARGVWTIGEMDVGEVVTLTIPTRVTISAHNITNVATVNSSTPDPDPTNNEDNDTVYLNPDVTVEKTVSARNSYHGQIISWNITVTNNGPNDALNVYVIDRLPAGLRFVNSTRPANYNPVTGRWDIKTLKDGESITLIVNTEVTIYDGFISNNATVYSSNDHDLDNNYDEDYTQVRTEADVGIVKMVSNQTSRHGDEIEWTVIVTNHGPNTAENVYVIDFLPNADLIQTREPYRSKGQISHLGDKGLWTIGSLANGENATLIVYTKVLSTNKTIINVVNVTASTHDPDLSNNWAENGTYVPPEADVAVVKKVDNFTPNKNDNVVWTITVVNNGPNVAENVVVKDILPSGLKFVSNSVPDIGTYSDSSNTWTIGTLEVGVRHSLEITTTVIDTGKITNEVNATTSTYDTNLENNYDNETIDVPAIADLEITKLVSNKTPKYGDLINWTITVHNKGPNNARDVAVNDKLPAGLVYITHKGPGLYDSTQGIWQIGDLGIDASASLTITTRVNITNATITNVAVVTSTTPDNDTSNNQANNTTDVGPVADLAIIKYASNVHPAFNEEFNYYIEVVNNGPDAAVNAYVIDVLPQGLAYVKDDSNGAYDPATGKWTLGNVSAEKGLNTRVLNITVRVTLTQPDVITNIANVTSETPDPDLTNNEDNETIDVGHLADLEVIKEVYDNTSKYGDEVTWIIYVYNHGPNTAINTIVKDELPEGLIYVAHYADKGEYNPATGIWTIGNFEYVPVAGDDPFTYLSIVTKVNVTNKNITNVAVVNSTTPDPDVTNNEANNTTVVDSNADLEVIKEVSNKNPRFGETIIWTITVTNNGPNTAVDAYVVDKLPKGLIYKNDDSNGKYNPDTGYWNIGNLTNGATVKLNIQTLVNITNATITNVAVVNSTTPDNNTENNKANNTTDVDPEADLEIIKLVSNKTAKKGDVITWTIVVTNNGPDTALEVYVRDNLPAGLVLTGYSKTKGIFDEKDLTWYIKSLAKGESQTLNLTTLVNVTNKTLVNTVNVTNDVYDPNKTNNEANNTTAVPPEADLEVIKKAANKTYNIGDVVEWNITIINHGPDVVNGIEFIDAIDSGLIFVGSDNRYVHGFINVVLDVGDSVSFVVRTVVNTTNATLRNAIVVASPNVYDPNPSNNMDNDTINVNPSADLEIIKLVSTSTANKGDVVIWTINVTNNGPDVAVNTRVTDKLPAGLIYSGHKGEGNYDPETGVWIVGDLAKGESKQLVISTIANITNRTIVNVANVTSDTPDSNKTNNEANNTTVVDDIADLEVVKLVSNSTPKKGDEITWTIVVTNHGPDAAKGVNVTDKLPAGLKYNGHDGPGLYDSSKGIWIIGDMAKGETAKLLIRTIVEISNGTIENIAVVSSSTPDNNTGNNKGNNSTTVNDDADLVIVKVVSNKNPKFGDKVTWTITVTNKGPSDAKNVRVTDKLPAGLIFNGADGNYNKDTGLWIVGDLANGESASLVINTIVNITNTTIRNVANVTSDTPDSNKTNNVANNTTDVDPESDLVVVKEVSNKNPHFGETITWTITVTNNGPDTAKDAKVTDKLPAGLIFNGADGNYDPATGVWNIGDLANGASARLVITTLVNITNATITNVANVTSDTYDPNRTNNEGNNTTDVDPEADLEIIKLVSAKNINKGEIVVWTIVVTNNGPDAAKNIYVKDQLPAGLVYNAHTTSKGLFDSNSLTWYIDALANGESATLTLKTLANVSDKTLVNNVNVTNDVYDPNETNNKANNDTTVAEELPADLEVIKVVSKRNPHKGDVITWTITVVNHGPGTAKDVTVTDKLPAGLIFKKSNGNYNKNTGIWTVGDLANGESKSLVITTMVDITDAEITNIAVVKSSTPDPDESNNKDNDTTEIDPEADVKVVKTVSNPKPVKGDVITWIIVVVNLGPDAAENVLVEEDLPAGLKLISAKGTKGSFEDGIWTIGKLNNGEVVSLVLTTRVTASGGIIKNIVVATSSTFDPNMSNNKDKETATPKSKPSDESADLEITKVANVKKVKVGDKIVWKITVTNNGPGAAKNVRVYDVAVGDLKYLSSKASKGSFNSIDGVWTIGEMENGETVVLTVVYEALSEGTVINTVEVVSDTPDPDKSNNRDNSTVTVVSKDDPTPDTPTETPKTPTPKAPARMHETGNPVVMVLLALLAAVGVTLRRRN